jgi:hypothetical protein
MSCCSTRSGRSFDRIGVTVASCVNRLLVMRNASINIGFELFIVSPPLFQPLADDSPFQARLLIGGGVPRSWSDPKI